MGAITTGGWGGKSEAQIEKRPCKKKKLQSVFSKASLLECDGVLSKVLCLLSLLRPNLAVMIPRIRAVSLRKDEFSMQEQQFFFSAQLSPIETVCVM